MKKMILFLIIFCFSLTIAEAQTLKESVARVNKNIENLKKDNDSLTKSLFAVLTKLRPLVENASDQNEKERNELMAEGKQIGSKIEYNTDKLRVANVELYSLLSYFSGVCGNEASEIEHRERVQNFPETENVSPRNLYSEFISSFDKIYNKNDILKICTALN